MTHAAHPPPSDFFYDRRGQPQLAHCAVLFIDLLGTRHLAKSGNAGHYLQTLNGALSRSREYLDPSSAWPAAYFSDSLVIASPIDDGSIASAVWGLAKEAARLQLDLLENGYSLRGGLATGDIHLGPGLLFGAGLVDAYELESSSTVDPRIVLSTEAASAALGEVSDAALVLDQDGLAVVDYLVVGAVEGLLDPVEEGLTWHRDLVLRRREEHVRNLGVWSKWNWVGQYHNAACDRLLDDPSGLLVSGVGDRSFTPIDT